MLPGHNLALIEAIHDLFRTMAKSLPGRVDLMVVIGLEDQPRVHFHHVVAADQRPTPAARQHLALKLRPVEAAAIEMKHASAAIGSIAETGYLNFEIEREQELVLISFMEAS